MNSIRLFLAMCLLTISTQSLALFMPAGFQVNSSETNQPKGNEDGGC